MFVGQGITNFKPMRRFELLALRLQGGSSTTELHRHIIQRTSVIYHISQDKSGCWTFDSSHRLSWHVAKNVEAGSMLISGMDSASARS
jgi:hypothetical protein